MSGSPHSVIVARLSSIPLESWTSEGFRGLGFFVFCFYGFYFPSDARSALVLRFTHGHVLTCTFRAYDSGSLSACMCH